MFLAQTSPNKFEYKLSINVRVSTTSGVVEDFGLDRFVPLMNIQNLAHVVQQHASLAQNNREEHFIAPNKGAVFVNGRPVRTPRMLRNKDIVRFGNDDASNPATLMYVTPYACKNQFLSNALIDYMVENFGASASTLQGLYCDDNARTVTVQAMMSLQNLLLENELPDYELDYLFIQATEKLASFFADTEKSKLLLRTFVNCVLDGSPNSGDIVFDDRDAWEYLERILVYHCDAPIKSKKERPVFSNINSKVACKLFA